jgi:hypothetical protein
VIDRRFRLYAVQRTPLGGFEVCRHCRQLHLVYIVQLLGRLAALASPMLIMPGQIDVFHPSFQPTRCYKFWIANHGESAKRIDIARQNNCISLYG